MLRKFGLKGFAVLAAMAAMVASPNAYADDEKPEILHPLEILKRAPASEWRTLDPENMLYLELPAGQVVVELRPDFAPAHVAQIKTLVRQGFYDGLKFHRVIEGFVAQGGDPKNDGTGGSDLPNIGPEFYRDTQNVSGFSEIGRDRVSARVGYIDGVPVAAESEGLRAFVKSREVRIWPLHCPGAMSMARATPVDSANSQFFVVIGDARQSLDKRYSIWGWIVDGFEATRRIVRGEPPARATPIIRARIGTDMPKARAKDVQILRTDTQTFKDYLTRRAQLVEGVVKNACDIRVPVKINGEIER